MRWPGYPSNWAGARASADPASNQPETHARPLQRDVRFRRRMNMAKNRKIDHAGPNRIQVRLWPRRGIGRMDEDCLAACLDDWRGTQLWEWVGGPLAGEMQTDAEFTVGDVVDQLCAHHAEPSLARIDLSLPYDGRKSPPAWLRARCRDPVVGTLCELYRDRLISADAVVQALGGFVRDAVNVGRSRPTQPGAT